MKLAADTNILFTFFWKHSLLRTILTEKHLQLISPEYALNEILCYKEEIKKKAKLSRDEFNKIFAELQQQVIFVPVLEYQNNMKEAATVIKISALTEDEKKEIIDDIDFLALSLKLNCLLWSNDALLKKQKKIPVITTKELIDLLAELR